MADLWGSDVTVTTSRGYGSTLAIAEYALAGIMHFAKSLHRPPRTMRTRAASTPQGLSLDPARRQDRVRRRRRRDRPGRRQAVRGDRHARARHPPRRQPVLYCRRGLRRWARVAELDAYLPSMSDFVIVCAQWTPETTKLIDAQRFAAMKQGAILVNIARGEIVDEDALLAALKARSPARCCARRRDRRRIRPRPAKGALVRPPRADHPAPLGRRPMISGMAAWICSARTCDRLSTASR